MAIALRDSDEVVLIPNHISVAKPRMEPPTRRDAQIAASSGKTLYSEYTKLGKNVQDPPKKTAMKMLMIKR
jgi:hypothetical protein